MSGEIEVKYRITEPARLAAALANQGIVLSPPVCQDDQAYAPLSWSPGDCRIGVTFVRLRTQNEQCLFTTKTPVDNVLACREYETVVADRDQMHEAILAMGYRPTVRVVKARRTARVGQFALCVDDVEGVGTFLEVEAESDGAESMVEAQQALASWVDSLGAPLERVTETYDRLVAEGAAASVA